MKKIKNDSYLEIENFQYLIFSTKRLLNTTYNSELEYIDEWRKYFNYAVINNTIDNDGAYYITKEDIEQISIQYVIDNKNTIDNLIEDLTLCAFLMEESDKYYFNEEIYDKKLVENEKSKLTKDEKQGFEFEYIPSPWKLIETDKTFSILGYSDIFQEDTEISYMVKEDDKDLISDNIYIKEDLECLLDSPVAYELLKEIYVDLKKSNNFILTKEIKDVFNDIHSNNFEVFEINDWDEYYSFLEENDTHKTCALNVGELYDLINLFEIVNHKSSIALFHAGDINVYEILGCLSLVLNQVKMESVLCNIVDTLGNDNSISKKIIDFFGTEFFGI